MKGRKKLKMAKAKILFKCKVCAETFKSREERRSHTKNSHRNKIFKCKLCLTIFNTRRFVYENHKKTCMRKTFLCHLCKAAGKKANPRSYDTFIAHYYKKHPESERQLSKHDIRTRAYFVRNPYICDICKLRVPTERALETHKIAKICEITRPPFPPFDLNSSTDVSEENDSDSDMSIEAPHNDAAPISSRMSVDAGPTPRIQPQNTEKEVENSDNDWADRENVESPPSLNQALDPPIDPEPMDQAPMMVASPPSIMMAPVSNPTPVDSAPSAPIAAAVDPAPVSIPMMVASPPSIVMVTSPPPITVSNQLLTPVIQLTQVDSEKEVENSDNNCPDKENVVKEAGNERPPSLNQALDPGSGSGSAFDFSPLRELRHEIYKELNLNQKKFEHVQEKGRKIEQLNHELQEENEELKQKMYEISILTDLYDKEKESNSKQKHVIHDMNLKNTKLYEQLINAKDEIIRLKEEIMNEKIKNISKSKNEIVIKSEREDVYLSKDLNS